MGVVKPTHCEGRGPNYPQRAPPLEGPAATRAPLHKMPNILILFIYVDCFSFFNLERDAGRSLPYVLGTILSVKHYHG